MIPYTFAVLIALAALCGLAELVAECGRYERRRKGEAMVKRVMGA